MPKQTNFNNFTGKKIVMMQKKINRRPRLKLNFKDRNTSSKEIYHNFAVVRWLYNLTEDYAIILKLKGKCLQGN